MIMRLIDADELIKCIPSEEYNSRFAVMNAPTVEPQKWIPCSERLPENYTRVLTTNSKIGAWEVDINSRNFAGWIYSSDPVAWMSLPEPWKENKE